MGRLNRKEQGECLAGSAYLPAKLAHSRLRDLLQLASFQVVEFSEGLFDFQPLDGHSVLLRARLCGDESAT